MRPQNSSSSSSDISSSSSTQNQFLQNSTLLTALPPEMPGAGVKISVPEDPKIGSPGKNPMLAQWGASPGEIRIDITVPASALTLGKLLGEGGFGAVYQGLYNGEPVAIKRLKTQGLTDKAFEELRHEAKIMFQLGLESKYIVP
ncbi:MAG: protein kinase, partial [Proteobacteria bacterium]|nr:protein kinase [Pseudomonadota bacterium]